LNDGHVTRHLREPGQRAQRVAHVIEHAQEEHHVEGAEGRQIHRHEVADHRLDLTAPSGVRDIEPATAGEICGVPERGLLGKLHRQALCFALSVMRLMSAEVGGPDVVVQRDHAASSALFSVEAVEAIPRPDVEHRLVA
jgi:hypothetical protein